MSANEGAISLQPSLISHLSIPNVVMVPIAEKQATWDLSIVWQEEECPNLCVPCWTVFNSRPSLKRTGEQQKGVSHQFLRVLPLSLTQKSVARRFPSSQDVVEALNAASS
jgi:hypothetical protein